MPSNTNTSQLDIKPLHRRYSLYFAFCLVWTLPACSQPTYTANDLVPTIPGSFDYGVNMGFFPPNYGDKALAALASEYGASSIRPGLFHDFLETWGYDSRKEQFTYYDSIGLRNIVAILGFPAEIARDPAYYCPNEQSTLFDDLYKPIWDHGEHGTPINDDNPYALYVWKTVTAYKGLIKTYEIWNEPDLNTDKGWRIPGQPGNWWDNAPLPCETKLKAPPYFYIRTLRISYEVIKSVDPDALVAVGGLGWPSFLDVICRYTDEPFQGKVEADRYPLKGGAYFDCMSFHCYPHLDNSLEVRDESTGSLQYSRHSDAAVDDIWNLKKQFKTVLHKYGYDNLTYPEKRWICTEFNIPRRSIDQHIGSEAAQINFLIKTLVTAQMNEMAQMHVYSLADEKQEHTADEAFSYMGLFKNLDQVALGGAQPNAIAWALKTTAELLKNTTYSPAQTEKLKLPGTVRGAAFRHKTGQFTYVLWAKTDKDLDENVEADYAFPAELALKYMEAKPWHYSQSGTHYLMNARQLKLSGSPLFLNETVITNDYPKSPKIIPNPTTDGHAVFEFWMFQDGRASVEIFDSSGRKVAKLLENEALVVGPQALPIDLGQFPAGVYYVHLTTPESSLTVGILKLAQ